MEEFTAAERDLLNGLMADWKPRNKALVGAAFHELKNALLRTLPPEPVVMMPDYNAPAS